MVSMIRMFLFIDKSLDMKEECLICKAPLEYFQVDVMMECSICHRSETSKTRCVNGHFVCNECHSKGVDSIVGLCLEEASCDPLEIIGKNGQKDVIEETLEYEYK